MIDWTRLTPAVERAAGIAASNFPAQHDISDIKQELWLWIMEKKTTVTKVLSEEDGENRLVHFLTLVARDRLKEADAVLYGYNEEDRFYYSLATIKSILEVVFRYEDWQSFALSQDTQPKAKTDPSTGGNTLASYADIKSAVERLPEDYYNIIVWRYKYQHTFTQIGADTGTSKQAVAERHNRALRAIQALLGQQPLSELRRGYDGRTEARGNVSSQVRVQRDYEG